MAELPKVNSASDERPFRYAEMVDGETVCLSPGFASSVCMWSVTRYRH